uniref:Uncharacterized protein n=1 Tax=Strigamia maritima TaxID=126957 RepID=T1J4K1_STRMM
MVAGVSSAKFGIKNSMQFTDFYCKKCNDDDGPSDNIVWHRHNCACLRVHQLKKLSSNAGSPSPPAYDHSILGFLISISRSM